MTMSRAPSGHRRKRCARAIIPSPPILAVIEVIPVDFFTTIRGGEGNTDVALPHVARARLEKGYVLG